MKKYLSILVMAILLLVPLKNAKAVGVVNPESNCEDLDNDMRRCVIVIEDAADEEEIIFTLTEQGGADIQEIVASSESSWTVKDAKETSTGVWTVVISSPESANGQEDAFIMTYKKSGQTGCKISISAKNGNTVETPTPTEPTPTSPDNPPDDNPQTGATIPYVTFGAIALLAVGTYFATRKKSKMYKI